MKIYPKKSHYRDLGNNDDDVMVRNCDCDNLIVLWCGSTMAMVRQCDDDGTMTIWDDDLSHYHCGVIAASCYLLFGPCDVCKKTASDKWIVHQFLKFYFLVYWCIFFKNDANAFFFLLLSRHNRLWTGNLLCYKNN